MAEQWQSPSVMHGYNFEEAVWHYFDWVRRDPQAGMAELVREARAGTFKGQPLVERVMVAMVGDMNKATGVWNDEFPVPERPARFERRKEVRYPAKGKAAPTPAPTRAAMPVAPPAVRREPLPAAPAPRPVTRMAIPAAR